MYKNITVIVFCIFWFITSHNSIKAEEASIIMKTVSGIEWGKDKKTLEKDLQNKIVYSNKNCIVVNADALFNVPVTLNYLFDDKGLLYNISWYTDIPVDNIEIILELEKNLEKYLKSKFYKPAYVYSDGDLADANKIKEKLVKKRSKPEIPTVYYSKMNYWTNKGLIVYTNLLCITSGKCYLHLQFISKKQVRVKDYQPQNDVMFSYSLLDKDQDLVTNSNENISLYAEAVR